MHHAPSPAATVAAALAARAEEVCRRYLPNGRRLGRYWICGDLDGARGRSLFVRLSGSGKPGKLDRRGDRASTATCSISSAIAPTRRRCARRSTRRGGSSPCRLHRQRPRTAHPGAAAADEPYDATEAARRLWRRCHAVAGSHAERYLQARGLLQCRFAALRFHPELRYREGATVRRFPALVAAVTASDGSRIFGVQRTWLDPRRPAKAGVADPRKALGRIHGLAVRFGVAGRRRSACRRRGHRDGALARDRRAGDRGGRGGALRRQPQRVRAANRRRAPGHRPGQRRGRRIGGRAPRPALRAARASAPPLIVPVGKDFNDDLVDARRTGAARPVGAAVPLRGERRDERGVGRADPEERRESMERRHQSQDTSRGCARSSNLRRS